MERIDDRTVGRLDCIVFGMMRIATAGESAYKITTREVLPRFRPKAGKPGHLGHALNFDL